MSQMLGKKPALVLREPKTGLLFIGFEGDACEGRASTSCVEVFLTTASHRTKPLSRILPLSANAELSALMASNLTGLRLTRGQWQRLAREIPQVALIRDATRSRFLLA